MRKKFIKIVKKKLEDQANQIRRQLAQFTEENPRVKDDYSAKFPDYGTKEDENASEVATFQDELSLEKDLESLLQATQEALDRIKKGKYGVCVRCSQDIEEKRLEVVPTATLCLKCASIVK